MPEWQLTCSIAFMSKYGLPIFVGGCGRTVIEMKEYICAHGGLRRRTSKLARTLDSLAIEKRENIVNL
ncbi:hypothetical protein ACOSQ3_028122 [Xanthoceras sorbifolium]